MLEKEYVGVAKKQIGSLTDFDDVSDIPFCIDFTVFGDPVAKQRPRVTRSHTYTPKETADKEKEIEGVYISLYRGFRFEKDVPLRLEVDFYMSVPTSDSRKRKSKKMSGEIRPIVKKMDVDNGIKLVQDALNKVAYFDDSQIVEVVGRKFYSEKPRTVIRIYRVE